MSSKGIRCLIYAVGMLLLAVSVTINSRLGLGVAPISSVSYCASEIWGFSLGTMTFVVYCFLVLGQFLIRGRESRWYDLLQLPLSLLFGRAVDIVDYLFVYNPESHSLWLNIVLLLAAVFLTGVGISMSVNMKVVPNPPDGIVQAIAEKMGKGQGIIKNIFDVCCVLITAAMSLILTGRIIGIGMGTVVAVIGVGRSISLVDRLAKEKMCRAAGLLQEVK